MICLRSTASITMAVTATICVASCTNSKPTSTSADPSAAKPAASAVTQVSAPPAATKRYAFQFIQGVAGDQFYVTMQCGAEAEAAKLGVSLTTQGPQKADPTLQKPIVDSAMQAAPDAIIIAPDDRTAMQQPLTSAAQHTKVVLVDTTVDDPAFATSQIASDNQAGGAAAFRTLKELNPDGGKVLIVSTDPGITTVDARVAGFTAAGTDPKFTFLGVQYSHDDPATAANLMTAALQKDPDIVGVFATNILAAEGTAVGVRQAGKQGRVKIVAFDAGPAQIADLRAGTVDALIAQDPYLMGQYGVDQAVAALDGHEVAPLIQTGFHVITRDNVDTTGADAAYKAKC